MSVVITRLSVTIHYVPGGICNVTYLISSKIGWACERIGWACTGTGTLVWNTDTGTLGTDTLVLIQWYWYTGTSALVLVN